MAGLLPLLLAIPLAGVVAMLLAWNRPRASAWIAFATALAVLGVSLALVANPVVPVHRAGGWPWPFGISLAPGRAGVLMTMLAGLLFVCATAYRLGQVGARNAASLNPAYPLSFPILLLALMGLFTTGDLFNFYVFFELVAVGSYMLVALGKHEPIEAAWKYSAQSVLGSVSLLVGIALVYGVAGTAAFPTPLGGRTCPTCATIITCPPARLTQQLVRRCFIAAMTARCCVRACPLFPRRAIFAASTSAG